MFNFIKGLSRRGHQIHLVSTALDSVSPSIANAVAEYCDSLHLVHHPQSTWRRLCWIFGSLLLRKPFVVFKHAPASLGRTVRNVVSKVQPDVILLEFHYLSDSVRGIGLPKVVDMHNIDHVLYERLAHTSGWGLKKIHGLLQRPIMYNFERKIPDRFQACLTVSENDASILRRVTGAAAIWVVPNGVDVDYFRPGRESHSRRWDLIYVGSMDYYPNIDAVLFLCRRIMPIVWSSRPETSLIIVGRDPSPAVKRLSRDPRIIVTGEVQDVRYYWERASIAVLPLRIGGGTRLKSLEAASMAKPIVGTPIGLEGVPFSHNEHAILAERIDDFALAILDLLENGDKRTALGHAARSFVLEHYSWSRIVERLEVVLDHVVSQQTKPIVGARVWSG